MQEIHKPNAPEITGICEINLKHDTIEIFPKKVFLITLYSAPCTTEKSNT